MKVDAFSERVHLEVQEWMKKVAEVKAVSQGDYKPHDDGRAAAVLENKEPGMEA